MVVWGLIPDSKTRFQTWESKHRDFRMGLIPLTSFISASLLVAACGALV